MHPGSIPGQASTPPPDDEDDRAALVARWLELMRRDLPLMAVEHAWPIRLDHCFMRVCLDAALGGPWRDLVPAPAIRHLTDAQLRAAIGVAEGVRRRPASLPALNAASLEARRGRRFRRVPPRDRA